MKAQVLFGFLLLIAAVISQDVNLKPAEDCDIETCKLPDCRCSSTDIPGNISPRSVPQFVTLTFDDAVTTLNIETYRSILFNRKNSNGCPIGTTFYVSHEYTTYQAVNELYNNGFEIALHSMSHVSNQTYWSTADYDTLVKEFVDQRTQMSHFANIPQNSIKGVRMPFLQMAGDAQFVMMANHGLLYDASMPTISMINPGLWPYTLDYKSIQECIVPPCASSSIPGPWVLPMLAWTDVQGFPCSFVDACPSPPNLQDENAWFQFILQNFENHYLGNRAPFGFYVHEGHIRFFPAVANALIRFMNLLNSLNDVFMVNSEDVIQWVRNPVPMEEYQQQSCRSFPATTCNNNFCGPLVGEHSGLNYYLQVCTACPPKYPWLGNPLGQL